MVLMSHITYTTMSLDEGHTSDATNKNCNTEKVFIRVVGRCNPVVSQRMVHVLGDSVAAFIPDSVVFRIQVVQKLQMCIKIQVIPIF